MPCLPALADDARPLADTRESEQSYGLSLRPPVGTTVLRQTASRYLMQVLDEQEQFRINASVRKLGKAMTLEGFSNEAQAQLARLYPNASLMDEHEDNLAGRPATVIYVLMPPYKTDSRDPLVLGQAYIQIAADTFAIIEVESPAIKVGEGNEEKYEQDPVVRATYEAVLKTVEIKPPEELESERRTATKLTRDLFKTLDPDKVRAALIDEQVVRIIDTPAVGKAKDIGWMSIRQGEAERLDKPGIGVKVQARIVLEELTVDSLAEYFVADDDSFEEWSVTTTQRPSVHGRARARDDNNDAVATSVETGTRTGNKIDVRIDITGKSPRPFSFLKPDFAYLSQAHHWLLPQLLPADRPATYGFYYYNPEHAKVEYRTDQLIPTLAGFTLITRLSPNAPPLKAQYDTDRHLTAKHLTPTRKLIPTTPQELKRLWPNG